MPSIMQAVLLGESLRKSFQLQTLKILWVSQVLLEVFTHTMKT